MKATFASTLVCIPTYNERENIAMTIGMVTDSLPGCHVLVVDDRSPDGTGGIVRELSESNDRLHLLERMRKDGLGRAYVEGFRWALGKGFSKIIQFDADGSHGAQYLPLMVARLEDDEFVVGSRSVEGGGCAGWSLDRRLLSAGGNFYARALLGTGVGDLTGGFNGMRAEVLQRIDYESMRSTGYVFQIELKYRCHLAGVKMTEIPIVFTDRRAGNSKMSKTIVLEAFLSVLLLKLKL